MPDTLQLLGQNRGYTSAWESPFEGLGLGFVEYEILKLIGFLNLQTVNEIYDAILLKFPAASKSKSQFYRIVESLESSGFVKSSKEGKTKHLSLTQKGFKELGNLTRYVFDFLRERVVADGLWRDMVEYVIPRTGCLRNSQILFAGAQSYGIATLFNACRSCNNPAYPDEDSPFTPIFLKLPGADTTPSPYEEQKLQIIDTPNPFDWLPKKDSIDVFSGIGILTKFGHEVLDEVQRVLKPEGIAIFIEPVKTTPNIIFTIYNQLIAVNSVETAKQWVIEKSNPNVLNKKYLIRLIREHFEEIYPLEDTLLQVVIAKRPKSKKND